jgi:hypothetical protein
MMMLGISQGNGGPSDISKGFQHALGGGALGGESLRTGLQVHNEFTPNLQFTSNVILQQDNNTQSQEQDPSQADNTLLIVQKNRSEVQITTFEARNAPFQMRLTAIGMDWSGKAPASSL